MCFVAITLALKGDEEIFWGRTCRKVDVFTKEIGNKNMSKEKWEEAIREITMAGVYDVAFTDGSKLEDGKTEAG